MALNKAILGARHTGQRIRWKREDGSVQDLTGATISGQFEPAAGGAATAITGTLALVEGTKDEFVWAYSAGDIDTAGEFKVQFKALFSDATYDLTFEYAWEVVAAMT